MKKLNKKGFSLVELIIVIAIMAVLIGVLAPTYLGQVEKSKKSTDLQNAQSIATAIAVAAAQADDASSYKTASITTYARVSTLPGITDPAVQLTATDHFYYSYDGTNIHVAVSDGTAPTDDSSDLYPVKKHSDY